MDAQPAAASGSSARTERAAFLLLLFIFFVSGCAALIYQVVWTRRLFLTLGATSLAISTILTAFMAGLALGSLVAGRLVDRRKNCLVLYAILEVAIGVYGFLTPWLFDGVEGTFHAILRRMDLPLWPSLLLRFALSLSILIVPTSLMGATLPVLSKHVVDHLGHFGRRIGLLYGINTFGAACGVLLTGFLLIPTFGIAGVIYFAVSLNLFIALFAWMLDASLRSSRRQAVLPPAPAHGPEAGEPTIETHEGAPAAAAGSHRAVLLIAALGGFASLLCEVAWTRVLTLILGGAVHAFSIMLATFLVGLALGSFVLSRWIDRSRDLFLFYAVIEGLVAILSLLLLPFFGELPLLYVRFYPSASDSYAFLSILGFILCSLVMIVPTFLIGVTFPIVSKLYARDMATLGRRIGEVYFANTLGGIFGSFAAGFLCIPLIGMERTCIVAALINVAAAVLAASMATSPLPRRAAAWATAAGSIVLLFGYPLCWSAGRAPDSPDRQVRERQEKERAIAPRWCWNPRVLDSGVHTYMHIYTSPDGADLLHVLDDHLLLHHEEGLNAVVTVNALRRFPEILSLRVDGKTDASNSDDFPTEVLLAALPLLIHPRPEEVLVVGLGSGITAGTVTCYPSVKSVDVVEIEEAVVHGARLFHGDNYDILGDPDAKPPRPGHPRVHVTIEDARHYCAVTPKRYDVLIAEPSNPWMSGPSHLFTLEHFRNMRQVMKDDGIAMQWFHTYSMSPQLVWSVLKTFRAAFPHYVLLVYARQPSDLFLIGANHPIAFDLPRLENRFALPEVRRDLQRVGFNSLTHLLAPLVLRQEDFERILQGGPAEYREIARQLAEIPLNTDDFPYVEFEAPRYLHQPLSGREVVQSVLRYRNLPWPPIQPADGSDPKIPAPEVLRNLNLCPKLSEANDFLGLSGAAIQIAERGLEINPEDDKMRNVLAALYVQNWRQTHPVTAAPSPGQAPQDIHALEQARRHVTRLVERNPRNAVALANLGEIAVAEKNYEEAVRQYERSIAAGSGTPYTHNQLGYALAQCGRLTEAAQEFETTLALDPQFTLAYASLAEVYEKLRQYDKAIETLVRWYSREETRPFIRGRVRGRYEALLKMQESRAPAGTAPPAQK